MNDPTKPTPTPRTDAAAYPHHEDNFMRGDEEVSAEFARQLERELATAKEQLRQRDDLLARIETVLDDVLIIVELIKPDHRARTGAKS